MNNRQVAHAWANGTRQSGRGSHFYFEGASIYSYGPHFEIARIISQPTADVRGVVLFTTRDYNTTTAQHKARALAAIDSVHYRLFYVPRLDVRGDASGFKIGRKERSTHHGENVAALAHEYHKARALVLTCRVGIDYKLNRAIEARDKATAYVSIFSKELKKSDRNIIAAIDAGPMFNNTEENKINAKRAKAAEADAAEARRQEAAKAEAAAKAAEALPHWRNGGPNAYGFHVLPVALRLSSDGAKIETSHGADVPLNEARALYTQLKNGYYLGEKIGGFPIHGETGGILKIGCHNIPLSEVEALAASLNW